MAIGWVRAYGEEDTQVNTKVTFFERQARAEFRAGFSTGLRKTASDNSDILKKLKWGQEVTLSNGLAGGKWTKVTASSRTGFMLSKHLVEIAFVKRGKNSSDKNFKATLDYKRFDPDSRLTFPDTQNVLWGDLVQITKRGNKRCSVRVRGITGEMNTADLGADPLLEIYFIDVGQGDGVLVRTPDMKHLLIDGGLERRKQQTGKNAADLVDWKFFFDYGDFRVRLDSMMASHSDTDHYGGLHDLIRDTKLADRELDCLGVDVDTFHHPGLSRWKTDKNAPVKHADGLGPKLNDGFIRLLDDRADAESAFAAGASEKFEKYWVDFIEDILNNSASTKFKRVMVSRDDVRKKPLPDLWKPAKGCAIKVLAPVSYDESGHTALKDFGDKGKNTNGHSICLRLDYGKSRILLTGDLNTKSMHWLEKCYDDKISAFKCDVAKACHHGSHDISYRFLEAINAAATIISSGDAEGHAHPRPEIVAASACSGHKHVDRRRDKLVTPLIYMTEIERSVTLGAINRIDIKDMPTRNSKASGVIPGRHVDEMSDRGFMSPGDRKGLKGKKTKNQKNKVIAAAKKASEPVLSALTGDTANGRKIRIDVNLDVPLGPVNRKNASKRLWRSRVMHKTHYGLVTVRTDGDTIMCATLNETEEKWIIHTFPARFPEAVM